MEGKNSFKNKFKSLKFWFTTWATGLLTYIIIANRTEFLQVAIMLAAAPLGYCITNVVQKKILNKIGEKNDLHLQDNK